MLGVIKYRLKALSDNFLWNNIGEYDWLEHINSVLWTYFVGDGILPTLIKPFYLVLAVNMNWPPFQGKIRLFLDEMDISLLGASAINKLMIQKLCATCHGNKIP